MRRTLSRSYLLLLALAAARPVLAQALFFDDFDEASTAELKSAGWTLREAPGHPGVPGAAWRADAIELVADAAHPGGRLLRLTARTDGTPQGTVQSQICQARKFLRGTYSARIRFADEPVSGADGDPIIQAFYAVSPLRFDFDPEFSEIDWEYLANGGWGGSATRLYAIAWQTVRIEPWLAYNAATETMGSQAGWHQLTVQVDGDDASSARSRWFVDDRLVATHGGRNQPVQKMAISFSLWFSPTGLLAPSARPRVWWQDIDWVLHVAERSLDPAAVRAQVEALRAQGVHRRDEVAPETPPLSSDCNL